jgi:hypothetical protein
MPGVPLTRGPIAQIAFKYSYARAPLKGISSSVSREVISRASTGFNGDYIASSGAPQPERGNER